MNIIPPYTKWFSGFSIPGVPSPVTPTVASGQILAYGAENRNTPPPTNGESFEMTETVLIPWVGTLSDPHPILAKLEVTYTVEDWGDVQLDDEMFIDLTRATQNAMWLITWDPTQPVATRPLAIQQSGTWYTYGLDLPKNVTELYGTNGYIVTTYTYSPYGLVSSTGSVTQHIQWSSEFTDTELGLVYYNYRHYNPECGNWLNRDFLMEMEASYNLYELTDNEPIGNYDNLGQISMDTCNRVLQTLERKPGVLSRRIRLILKELKESDKNKGTSCSVTFSCDCKLLSRGAYSPVEKTIRLNPGAFTDARDMIFTIQHELIHARQGCFIPRVNTCAGSVCRELAANRDSGFCQFRPNRKKNNYRTVKDCIIQKAAASAEYHCNDFEEAIETARRMYGKCKSAYYLPY